MLPNFLVAGQGKCGTTLLWHYLNIHPDIFVPPQKEVPFFASDLYYYGLGWYEMAFYHQHKGEPLVGDCFSANLSVPWVPQRVWESLDSDIRIIIALRHPVDRAISDYNMAVQQLRETEPFEKAITLEDRRSERQPSQAHGVQYLTRGKYAVQLKRYLEYYSLDQMLIIIYEKDIVQNLPRTVESVYEFLGVDTKKIAFTDATKNQSQLRMADSNHSSEGDVLHYLPLNRMIHNPSPTVMSAVESVDRNKMRRLDLDWDRELYDEHFAADVIELEQLVGIDLSIWCERYT